MRVNLRTIYSVAVIAVLGCVLMDTIVQAQEQQFEVPRALEASHYLAPDVVRGDHHVVQEAVTNDGYMNNYTIDSEFGLFQAYGEPLLAIRLREIGALAELDALSKTKVFADAIARGAMSQVTSVAEFASHPAETVKGVPDGVKRMFKRTKRTVKQGTETAKELLDDDDAAGANNSEGSEQEADDNLLQEGAEAGQKYAKKYFGVSRAERRWAEKLGVDPYTSNEVLRRQIKKVAKVDAAGSFAVRLAPIPKIPGVGYIQDVSKLVWRTDPWELRELNHKSLVAMDMAADTADAFLDNPWFNPSAQTFLVSVLSQLGTGAGQASAVELAAEAESQEEAIFFIQSVGMLAGLKREGVEIAKLVSAGRLPGALTDDGRVIFLIPVDHIFWTDSIALAADGPFAEAGKQVTSREVWFRGNVSTKCRTELETRGWLVRDQVRIMVAAESS